MRVQCPTGHHDRLCKPRRSFQARGRGRALPQIIDGAEEVREPATSEQRGYKPRLLVENCNPDQTVAALRDLLAGAGGLYDRGVPVRLAFDQIQRGTVAQMITPDALVLMAHTICRPYVLKARQDGKVAEVNARLPRSLAVMYLDWRGEWRLPPLNGIASAPLMQDEGAINSTQGHDLTTGMWCENVPDLTGLVPERPTKDVRDPDRQRADCFRGPGPPVCGGGF
jgi:hypothetical protein